MGRQFAAHAIERFAVWLGTLNPCDHQAEPSQLHGI
jgi:hypothetical protein